MTFLMSSGVSIADNAFAHAEHIHVVVFDVLRTKVGRSQCGSSLSSGYWNRLEGPGGKKPTCAYSAAMVPLSTEALAKIAANSSLFRLAPPTSAPPTSGSARIARAFEGLTEPP